MGQRNEAEVGGDTRDIRLAGSMSVMAMLQQLSEFNTTRGSRQLMHLDNGPLWAHYCRHVMGTLFLVHRFFPS